MRSGKVINVSFAFKSRYKWHTQAEEFLHDCSALIGIEVMEIAGQVYGTKQVMLHMAEVAQST